MKKRIVDLLPEGAVQYDGKVYRLNYIFEINGMRCHKTYVIINPLCEIEETWEECRVPLSLTSLLSKNIGISRIASNPREIQEAKQWVFNSILYGILAHDAEPKSPVYIWSENVKEGFKICGLCEIW